MLNHLKNLPLFDGKSFINLTKATKKGEPPFFLENSFVCHRQEAISGQDQVVNYRDL
jgi:hypothetical protein